MIARVHVRFPTLFSQPSGKSALEVALFVGLSNGIWLFGPLVGCYAAVHVIDDDDYSFFWGKGN